MCITFTLLLVLQPIWELSPMIPTDNFFEVVALRFEISLSSGSVSASSYILFIELSFIATLSFIENENKRKKRKAPAVI